MQMGMGEAGQQGRMRMQRGKFFKGDVKKHQPPSHLQCHCVILAGY